MEEAKFHLGQRVRAGTVSGKVRHGTVTYVSEDDRLPYRMYAVKVDGINDGDLGYLEPELKEIDEDHRRMNVGE